MKDLYRWSGTIAVIAACGYFLVYVFGNWSQLPETLTTPKVLVTLIMAPFILTSGFLFTATAWHLLLDAMGEMPKRTRLLCILLISQIAKYLPGNVGHHVGRVVMARNAGLSSGPVVLTMTLEAGGAILAATGVAFLALMVDDAALLSGAMEIPGPGKLIAFGLAACMVSLGAILLVKKLPSSRFHQMFGTMDIRFPGFRALFSCYFLYVANFLVLGAILYVLAAALTDGQEGHFWLLTGVFAVAWVAGFITPGAPGGLGVREAIMVAALDPVYGPGVALSLALGLRIVTTIGDAIGFLSGLALRRYLK